jgi:response regulator of citrate/malate metabolism
MDNTIQIKIFIVEDDFIFTSILNDMVESIQKEFIDRHVELLTKTFYSIKEARFELIKKPDIVFLDYYIMDDKLEPVTGDELLDEIKKIDRNIQVVMISGQEDKSVIETLKQKGAAFYINKDPKSLQRLIPVMRQIIEKILENRN